MQTATKNWKVYANNIILIAAVFTILVHLATYFLHKETNSVLKEKDFTDLKVQVSRIDKNVEELKVAQQALRESQAGTASQIDLAVRLLTNAQQSVSNNQAAKSIQR